VAAVIAFDRLEHFVRVPVRVGNDTHSFLLDTGIGLTVVSTTLADRVDVVQTGESFAGRRMSGQVVEVPLVRLRAMELGDLRVEDHVAGVIDLGDEFAGILGPGFFEGHPPTIDPDRGTVTIQPASEAASDGLVVPIEVERDGPSFTPFVPLILPSGRKIRVEIDTGSHNLILDTRFLAECGPSPDGPAVETTTGTDETGHEWTRHYATIIGSVHLADAPQTAQEAPRVMFQDIIYDGLIGTDYLGRYRVTYDIAGGRLILHV